MNEPLSRIINGAQARALAGTQKRLQFSRFCHWRATAEGGAEAFGEAAEWFCSLAESFCELAERPVSLAEPFCEPAKRFCKAAKPFCELAK